MRQILCQHRVVRRVPYVSLLAAGFAVLVALLPSLASWLQYERPAIASGELWRLISGHWTHVSGAHLFWDVLMFLGLGIGCEQHSRTQYGLCMASAVGSISLALWVGSPDLTIYRGLSGIDSALFILLAVTHLKHAWRAGRWVWALAMLMACAAFASKVGYELVTDHTLFVSQQGVNMVPVPLAHAVGALSGLAIGLLPPRSAGSTKTGTMVL